MLLLALSLLAAPETILVFQGDSAEHCYGAVRTRTLLSATGLLVEPTRDPQQAHLNVWRQALPNSPATEQVRLSSRFDNRSVVLTGPGPDLVHAALAAVWPADLPPLPPAGFGATPPEALEAACRQDPQAYRLAGATAAQTLALQVPATESKGLPAYRWARARTLLTEGRAADAVRLYEALTRELQGPARLPRWRQNRAHLSSNIQLVGDRAVVFSEGRFAAFDLATGFEVWRRSATKSEPSLSSLGTKVIAVDQRGVTALDPQTGVVAWRLGLDDPAAEFGADEATVYFSTNFEVIAVDRASGKLRWRTDPGGTIAAGPFLAQKRLLVPLQSSVVVLNPDDGRPEKQVSLGDELGGPLVVTADTVWALVGSDQLIRLDLDTLTPQSLVALGAAWPPLVYGERLALRARQGRTLGLFWVDETTTVLRNPWRDVLLPVQPLEDLLLYREGRGKTLVARREDGQIAWKQLFGPIRAVAPGASIWVASGTRVDVLDPERGQKKAHFELDSEIVAMAAGPDGAVAGCANGALYGLASPSAPEPWVGLLQQELTQALLAARQAPRALKLAEGLYQAGALPSAARLRALALSANKRPESAAAWLPFLAQPADDPLAIQARLALEIEVGLQSVESATTTPKLSSFATESEPGHTLVIRRDPTGDPTWKTQVEGQLRIIGTGPQILLAGEDRLVVLDAERGARLAETSLSGVIRGASRPGELAVQTATKLLVLDPTTLTSRYEIESTDDPQLYPTPSGWLLARDRRLRVLRDGAVVGVLLLPEPVEHWVSTVDRAFGLSRNEIVAVALDKVALKGRLAGEFSELQQSEQQIFVRWKDRRLGFGSQRALSR